MDRAVSNASYITSGGATVIGLLTVTEWVALGGLVLAVLTFIVNWWYRRKHYQLEERKTAALEKQS